MTATERTVTRRVSARVPIGTKLRDLVARRELIASLVRKELKVKYKNSALGFLWSLLNPALYLLVFWLVFTYFLKSGIPRFAIYLLCGLLPWNLLSNSLISGVTSVTANGSLVKKIWFPREVLPVASVGAGLVNYFLQAIVLTVVVGAATLLSASSPAPDATILLIVPALVAQVLLCLGLAILISAANVKVRDTQHLLELVLLLWFWMTPIVYQASLVRNNIPDWAWQLYLLNPMTPIVMTYQRAIYGASDVVGGGSRLVDAAPTPVVLDESIWWYLSRCGAIGAASVLLIWLALRYFSKAEANFAEEL